MIDDVRDIAVGMKLQAGIEPPTREVTVCGEPYQLLDGRWRVPVEYRTGTQRDEPLVALHWMPKRVSARRVSEDEVRMPLRDLVKVCNQGLPVEHQFSEEQLAERLRKVGLGQ